MIFDNYVGLITDCFKRYLLKQTAQGQVADDPYEFQHTVLPILRTNRDLFQLKAKILDFMQQWHKTPNQIILLLELSAVLNQISLFECYFSLVEERLQKYIAGNEGTWTEQAQAFLHQLASYHSAKNISDLKQAIKAFCETKLKGWIINSRNLKTDLESIAMEMPNADRTMLASQPLPLPFPQLIAIVQEDASLVAALPEPTKPMPTNMDSMSALDKLRALTQSLEELRIEHGLAIRHARATSDRYHALLANQEPPLTTPESPSPSLLTRFRGFINELADDKSKENDHRNGSASPESTERKALMPSATSHS